MANDFIDATRQANIVGSEAVADTTIELSGAANDDANIPNGSVTLPKLATAVVAMLLGAGRVITAYLANSSVTTEKIADGAVTTEKLASDIDLGGDVADGSITTAKLADNAVTNAKIGASAVGETEIANFSIKTGKLAAFSVTGEKVANGTITQAKLASDVDFPLTDGEVTEAKLASAVQAKLLGSGNVSTSNLADDSVTIDKLTVDSEATGIKAIVQAYDNASWSYLPKILKDATAISFSNAFYYEASQSSVPGYYSGSLALAYAQFVDGTDTYTIWKVLAYNSTGRLAKSSLFINRSDLDFSDLDTTDLLPVANGTRLPISTDLSAANSAVSGGFLGFTQTGTYLLASKQLTYDSSNRLIGF